MVEEKPENVGVINPYALAEAKLKRKVAWDRVSDPRKLLEDTLGMSYTKLFDPKNDSPLYAGLKYRPETKKVERVEVPPFVGDIVDVGAVVWIDPGDYFVEATELTDPLQGAVANCYFIAALCSVAWARTYVIAHRCRVANASGGFVDIVEFHKTGKQEKVEVTERLPLNSPGNTFIYARSGDPGEIWPAIYEKAYAKWITNDSSDTPDILKTAFGDPVGAEGQLTGLTPYYYWNAGLSADDIWNKVRQNCISRKTFNPMVAWTYSSGDTAPDKVNYSDANLVANHCYSILGWQYANNQMYIVLRNPWGWKEATMNIDGGSWTVWDAPHYGGPGLWRLINMATNDGIFALRADTFKKYFAGFGMVKE